MPGGSWKAAAAAASVVCPLGLLGVLTDVSAPNLRILPIAVIRLSMLSLIDELLKSVPNAPACEGFGMIAPSSESDTGTLFVAPGSTITLLVSAAPPNKLKGVV